MSKYEEKFANFIKMIDESKGKTEAVMIHNPNALGDTYEEVVESLDRLSDAKLGLIIVPRSERTAA